MSTNPTVPDARGWYWHEKLGIRLAWWAFKWMDRLWFTPLWMLRLPVYGTDSRIWMWLAGWAWLVTELGDLPEHKRVREYPEVRS